MKNKLQAEKQQALLAVQGKVAIGTHKGILVFYDSII